MSFFPLWDLSQLPWRPRFPDEDSWDRYVTNANLLPRSYALQKRWDLSHPHTKAFLQRAELFVRMRIRHLKGLQRHLDL